MAIAFNRPVALDPAAGVFIFAEAATAPLEGFDPSVLDVIPCPVEWQAETFAEWCARTARRRRERRQGVLA